ncbi:hypothetical protein [Leptolyngbya sp. FACHB-261]|uniref:hypothetical protein n=1 Tax=Leptolyngbya sp. FACHB-261 TaxID=2692806 RepID=UPI00168707BF|nr:hypothetical protein [Leptolyngbya sp. FACHB-261]MBD2102714.1 hypothetical protein [Leptolyngbya sp. FACHB-261]
MISVSPRKITQFLVYVVAGLTFANIAAQFCKYFLGRPYLFGLVPLFDTDIEASIPTWYSSVALLFCALLLALITLIRKQINDRFVLHWGILSFIFLYLSCDEALSIHEKAIRPLRSALNTSGLLYQAWVIPGIAFVLLVLLVYLKFLAALPPKTLRLFLISGAIYLAGALGMELVGGYYSELHGEENIAYAMITTLEECLEMLGIVAFIYTLLSYISVQVEGFQLDNSLTVQDQAQNQNPSLLN